MTRDEVMATLISHEWFAGLPSALAEEIVAVGRLRKIASGGLVYAEGDESTGMFGVLSGTIRLTGATACGRPIIYRALGPGGWFGHLTVIDGGARFQDAHAAEPAELLHLTTAGFEALLTREPRWAIEFSRLICRDIRISMSMMADYQATPLLQRIGHMVIEMSAREAAHQMLDCPLTQEALAALVGTSRQTVNRALRGWEKEGLLSIEYGRIRVHDSEALSRAVGPAPRYALRLQEA